MNTLLNDKIQQGTSQRKDYHPPRITEFGAIEQLTKGGGGTAYDAPTKLYSAEN